MLIRQCDSGKTSRKPFVKLDIGIDRLYFHVCKKEKEKVSVLLPCDLQVFVSFFHRVSE